MHLKWLKKISASQVLALVLLPFVLSVLAVLYLVVVACQGRPFLYTSERMKSPCDAFRLYKIRTMHPPDGDGDERVLAGEMVVRVTPIGRILRKTRLDELPQIFNVLKGDVRFIGPRPPLRRYVDAYPDIYTEVFRDTLPGITGLATVMLHRREEQLLSACTTASQADHVYRTRCIPIKARLDGIHRKNRGIGLDLLILYRTLSRLWFPARPRSSCVKPVPRTAALPVMARPAQFSQEEIA